MTWTKKLLLPLLVVSFSLLLSVFGFETSVSAATSRNLSGFSDSQGAYTGSIYFNKVIRASSSIGKSLGLNDPTFTFNSTLRSKKTSGIKIEFYALVTTQQDTIVAPLCPSTNPDMYLGRYSTTDCTVEVLNKDTFVSKWNYIENAQVQGNDYLTPDLIDADYYLHYSFIAYNKSDSFVSTSSLQTYGSYMRFYNPNENVWAEITILSPLITDDFEINVPSPEEQMNDKDDQDRASIEAQTSDTQDGADESSAQAQATGTTLMGAFSAFVTALATVHETNCRLPSMTIYGMQLGQMDLCTFDVPPGLVALATIGMVFIIVPMSFHLVRRLINIFRSFSG